jgi:hypothetical protein
LVSTDLPTEQMALTHLLVVGDLEGSRVFYRDVLAAEVYREPVGLPQLADALLRGMAASSGSQVREPTQLVAAVIRKIDHVER